MAGLGIGCGVGLGGPRLMTPSQLHGLLLDVFGASLIGLWVGEDLVADDSGNVVSWPGRGSVALANATANRFSIGSFSGRLALSPLPTIAQAKALSAENGTVFKTVIAAAMGTPAVNAYECVADRYDAATNTVLQRSASASTWFAGWTHYTDGVATESIPTSGAHVFEGSLESNTTTGVRIGGWPTGNRCWPVPIGCAVYLSAVPAPAQRAASLAVLRAYYSIP